jgi:hypothetical protein
MAPCESEANNGDIEERSVRTNLIGSGMLVLFGAVASLSAHHAFSAEFDANRPLHLTGTITKIDWVNPHAWIYIDVKNPDGTVDNWGIEGGTPNALFRRGITRESLQSGAVIVVDGYQAKNGTKRANGRDITFPDGKKLFLGSSGTGAPYETGADKKP